MTSSNNIIAKFEAAFEAFKTTDERPTNFTLHKFMTPSPSFYPILYDSVGDKHNMMGMIDKDAAYATKYGESFPRPVIPGIYASGIE